MKIGVANEPNFKSFNYSQKTYISGLSFGFPLFMFHMSVKF